jgi:hypothetical protein
MLFSISHWGMIEIDYAQFQSYWDFVWWANADERGANYK